MAQPQYYDQIGVGYADARVADPRIFAQVLDALGDVESVVHIGAGTGNYEPTDRRVVAVEPNEVMISQRTVPAPVVRAFAESLPLADDSFDAALAMFTIHHWPDRNAGLAEMGRVARRQVALVYDDVVSSGFWLQHYFPEIAPLPTVLNPSAQWMGEYLRLIDERPLMIPDDCTDGFTGCYWNRPERFLDPRVQAGMSILARLSDKARAEGSRNLAAAIESGEWDDRFGYLRDLTEYDMGYRLAICERR